MSWKKLLQDNKVHRHETSLLEITEIRRLVARGLADAASQHSRKTVASPLLIMGRFKRIKWRLLALDIEPQASRDIIG